MKRHRPCCWPVVLLTALLAHAPVARAVPLHPRVSGADTLHYHDANGRLETHVVRQRGITGSLTVRSGAPRLLTMFPEGDCGGALWFEPFGDISRIEVEAVPAIVGARNGLHGLTATMRAATRRLRTPGDVRHSIVLASVRFFRDVDEGHRTLPDDVSNVQVTNGTDGSLLFRRRTLDRERIEMRIEPLDGAHLQIDADGRIQLDAAAGRDALRFRVTTEVTYPAMLPIPMARLFRPGGAERLTADQRTGLAMLAYHDRFLAGMPRYATYFGRDTLTTLALDMDALSDEAIEDALGSVLEHVRGDGNVSHEETVGEYAVWQARTEGRAMPRGRRNDDYGMIDTPFMLAPTLWRHLARRAPRDRASFLARRTADGRPYRDVVRQNLQYVLQQTRAYAEASTREHLLSVPPERPEATWRDGVDGLARGRTPYDVNVVYAPAALEAAAALFTELGVGDEADRAQRYATAWSGARSFFHVEVPAAVARNAVRAYAQTRGIDEGAALAALGTRGPIAFDALALDRDGAPIAVMHTDVGARMLFTQPAHAELDEIAAAIMRPFPAGLLTPAGLVVSNPAFAPAPVQQMLCPGVYQGSNALWPVQESLVASGLARQLARPDLPPATRERLLTAQRALQRAVDAWPRTAEVYRVSGRDLAHAVAMGNDPTDLQESSDPQLWSEVPSRFDAPATH